MNPQKIGQFLDMLSNEYEDVMPAVEMFHYVLTIEAMYLQMMTTYFIQSEDMDAVNILKILITIFDDLLNKSYEFFCAMTLC